MADLAKTACCRCREQKVLAAFRAQPKKRKLEHPPSELQRSNNDTSPASSGSPAHSFHPSAKDYDVSSTSGKQDIQLSIPVQELLQEVYFTCMFNSTLIFHRPTFRRGFEEKKLPRYLLLAMYASATTLVSPVLLSTAWWLTIGSFLPSSSTLAKRHASLLRPLGDVQAMGRQWALQAGKEVLQDIDQPCFESVQTCEVLTLYWFSAGDSMRNTMFLGIAYMTACTLGLDFRNSTPSLPAADSNRAPDEEWLDAEKMRRCFWAVWFTQCINADHTSMRSYYIDRIMDLPLPIDETSFSQRVQPQSYTFANVLNRSTSVEPSHPDNTSIMAELMILILHWSKIRDLIRATNRIPIKDWLADLFELEGRLSKWYEQASPSFGYSRRNLYEQLVINQEPVYIFIHALYHQCRLVLHSSLVPQFSGLQFDERPPSEVTSLSARIALKSTQALSALSADLIALDWNPGQIPAFVGYCMYVSASINIALLYARDATLAVVARSNLISNVRLLKLMKLYWTNLERLWVRVNVLYGTQLSRHRNMATDGPAWAADSETALSDLDRIAAESRDTGQLTEPLAHSVLEYGLRKLTPSTKTDANAGRDQERSSYPDDLAKLMDESLDIPLAPASATPTHPFAAGVDQGESSGSLGQPLTGDCWDRAKTPVFPFLQGNEYDSWQFNLNSIQDPSMPYDDFLGIDFSF